MQQQDRERSLACYGLHTCGEAVTRRVPPKAAGSPDHAISSVHREDTSESSYEGAARQASDPSVLRGRRRGPLEPAGARRVFFNTSSIR